MSIIFQSILWSIFGIIIYRERLFNANIPRLLGRALYWVGVPLQIFFLARNSNFEHIVWLPPVVTVLVLLLGLALALIIPRLFKQLFFDDEILSLQTLESLLYGANNTDNRVITAGIDESKASSSMTHTSPALVSTKPAQRDSLSKVLLVTVKHNSLATRQKIRHNLPLPETDPGVGSFILASILCSTGFIDLVLIPPLVDFNYWSWIVLYGITHNIIGSYGLGVFIADRYSRFRRRSNWLNRLQDLLFLPSLWAFTYGYLSRNIALPDLVEGTISKAILLVVPGAFILIGMQLSELQQWQNLRLGAFPTILKMLIIPGLTGLLLTCFGLHGDSRLVLVLMSSMPTAFASIILTEEYKLNRQIVASSVLLSTLFLPVIILFWLSIF